MARPKKVAGKSSGLDAGTLTGKQERKEVAEYEKAQRKDSDCDPITEFLRVVHKNPNLKPIEQFVDGRLPYLPDGSLLKVRFCYPQIHFIVDGFPKGTKQDDIDTKKWEYQRLGYRFSWLIDGEELECDPSDPAKQEIIERANPLKEEPKTRMKFSTDDIGKLFYW
jgi:hypothetical protein